VRRRHWGRANTIRVQVQSEGPLDSAYSDAFGMTGTEARRPLART
jgi:hypothetical protein